MVTRTEGKQEALKEHCGHFSQCAAVFATTMAGAAKKVTEGGTLRTTSLVLTLHPVSNENDSRHITTKIIG